MLHLQVVFGWILNSLLYHFSDNFSNRSFVTFKLKFTISWRTTLCDCSSSLTIFLIMWVSWKWKWCQRIVDGRSLFLLEWVFIVLVIVLGISLNLFDDCFTKPNIITKFHYHSQVWLWNQISTYIMILRNINHVSIYSTKLRNTNRMSKHKRLLSLWLEREETLKYQWVCRPLYRKV